MKRVVCTADVMAVAAVIFGEGAEEQKSELLAAAGLQLMAAGDQPFVLVTFTELRTLTISLALKQSSWLGNRLRPTHRAAWNLCPATSAPPHSGTD